MAADCELIPGTRAQAKCMVNNARLRQGTRITLQSVSASGPTRPSSLTATDQAMTSIFWYQDNITMACMKLQWAALVLFTVTYQRPHFINVFS